MRNPVFTSFTLPSGLVLKNRIAKAAMEENLAQEDQTPSQALKNVYSAWAKGGTGLIITGNVMVDHLAMTGPGGLVLEQSTDITAFAELARLSKQNNCKVVMQINHPGRQVFKKMGGKALSASSIALNMGKHSHLFGVPKAMTQTDIDDVITRFTQTALQAEKAGFNGVQIHAAHGYLLAQFLSPLTNKRDDKWGGSLQNRARLLLEITRSIKAVCSPTFSVSVKLNSADFQRGGFESSDAQVVVDLLNELNVDFVELSGGSYEAPAMQGKTGDERTLAREAYFLEFAKAISHRSSIPIMTTGGISRLSIANNVIESGVALVGIATALAYQPNLPNKWQNEPLQLAVLPSVTWQDKTLAGLATMALVKRQIRRIGQGKSVKTNASPIFTLISDQLRSVKLTKRYRNRFASEIN
ncbi:NADH:flavin oxidoreductase/NADH oxidase family protein [Pseudoalteromonas sp. NZS127_1]|uniref:NADH:flavin oxidoreductase/NADH oxidase family protein n=1 Tax=unclassified Pseudoalteromonas TaxID=194690 RepID=UPI0013FE2DAA|nr:MULTISPECIES: NADH:flavin oxidoreductase/NADH oxidase family protein [unclassified Pseudoalteromonas]MBG9995558.1 NADH:flavin oxidoreductase/NADH oxidase family protein [Pseudoalteromonas sp. NZS127_1]MBH0011535.1 NADH:flavin oxidoreductase/NADH oxidase family protein [Pseudoalteromonas sp. NZS100_1]MBH0075015.1 NADH:flavin oxidoreductase/NADH oxidase family protein [Pseudoalteromonas sp. SWYJ118]